MKKVKKHTLRLPSLAGIDAEAALLLRSATEAVAHILHAREALDKAGQAHLPLIVVKGEMHTSPAHRVHHMLVLNGLKDIYTVAVGIEQPHNLFEEQAAIFKRTMPKSGLGLKERGRFNLMTTTGCFDTEWAPHTHDSFRAYIITHGLPVAHTDAAMTKNALDVKDASTVMSIRAMSEKPNKKLDCMSRKASGIRNHHMAKKAVELCYDSGARILVQVCGNFHVMGDGKGWKARDSLCGQFRKISIPYMAMPISVYKINDKLIRSVNDIFVADGLPDSEAIYRPRSKGLSKIYGGAAYTSHKDEAAYFNGLLERVGMGDSVISVKEMKALRRDAENVVLRAIHGLRRA